MSLRLASMLMAVLTAAIAVLGDWSSNPALSALWCLPAALLLAGLAYESLFVSRSRIRLQISAPSTWYLGRGSALRFEVRHEAQRAITLQAALAAPDEFARDDSIRTLSVMPRVAASLELQAIPRRLGAYAWPATRIRVAGPLGLAWWPRQISDSYQARVVPDLIAGGARTAGIGSIGARTGLTRGSGSELMQLRPYQPGDSPRVVDWKASARARRLISRDFSEDHHLQLLIMIDAGRASGLRAGELDRLGHYANAAAGLAQHAAALDDAVGLIVFADRPLIEIAPARGTAAVMRIRNALSSARVEKSESNPLQAAFRARSLARHRSLIVFLTDLDDTTAAGQLAAAVRILQPKHLPFVAGLSSAAAEALADAPADRWLDPYRALAAQTYLTGLDRKVRALKALGAPALIAKPGQIDVAVFEAYARFRRQRRV